MKLEIKPRLFSKDFRWIEFNLWKKLNDDSGLVAMKIHTKFPLSFYTLKLFVKGGWGSVFVVWP